MKRISICLVSAAIAAAACGDDVTSSSGAGGGGGTSATVGTTTTASTTTATTTGGTTTTTTGQGGQGGSGAGGAGGAATGGGGQGGSGGGVAPPFRNEVDMADEPLAVRALQIVGADIEGHDDGCLPCHALTESNLTSWKVLTNDVLDECLTDLAVSTQEVAIQMLDCVKSRSGIEGSNKFATPAIGFWAAGANRDWWKYTFKKAYPEDGEARWAEFFSQVRMPPNVQPRLTDEEYDIVGEWFVRGAPLLDELLDEEPPPGQCDALVTPALADYVADRMESGWRSQNASNGMLMFGCQGDEAAIDCLSDEPEVAADWHVEGQGSIKRLASVDYDSSFWTRGSADGRFVGHGTWTGAYHAAIIDLQADRVIPVDAYYDPGFFPDNAGFVFQGANGNMCSMDVLTSEPESISMNEPGCSYVGEVGLYQHVGAGLGGGDYFAVDGPFVSDDGGHTETLTNPDSYFGSQSIATFTPMVFNGQNFVAAQQVNIPTPFDGDAVISPSAGLLLSRTGGDSNTNIGYTLRSIDATPNGHGFDVETSTVGRYCLSGGKPSFSYDERWIVLHHYVENTDADAIELGFTGKNDPGFSGYRQSGASNLVLIEVATGQSQRITNMPPGRYALFPFFRSDGWIYFMSRTAKPDDGEQVMASDAALLAEGL